jgi:hypothetical protein
MRSVTLFCLLVICIFSASASQAIEIRQAAEVAPGDLPRISVVSQDENGLDLVFEMPVLSIEEIAVGSVRYQSVAIPGGGVIGDPGHPTIPVFTRLISIPAGASVSVSAERDDETTVEGIHLIPMQEDQGTVFAYDEAAYALHDVGALPAATIGRPAIARDLRVLRLSFQPVRYNPAERSLVVSGTLRVHVAYSGRDPVNEKRTAPRAIPASFDRLYRSIVVNYDGPPPGTRVEQGTWLIIAPNNTAVTTRLQPLVDWRTRQGLSPRLVTTAQTGTTAESIKSYIQTAYDTWDPPLEYVVLAADAAGTYSLPTWYESLSGAHGEGDHPYTLLEGGDALADVHIGRISFSTTTELEAIVNKITGYEKDPYLASDPDWFTRACLVGDPYDSGYSTVQVQQWIKTRLLQIGYAAVDTVFDNPFVEQMTTDLNRGGTLFSYRGTYGMSGWTNGNTYALTNGWKMPFAVTITCGTGSFAGETSRSEGFLRANSGANAPRGGIAAIGTATTGTHTKQNNCIHYGIFYALLYDGETHVGAALTRGKYELYLNFEDTQPNDVTIWSYWNNLMGDPALDCLTGFPDPLTVEHPANLPIGSNEIPVTISDQSGPVGDALVCAWKGSETYAVGNTDESGQVVLPVSTPTAGSMLLTVTKHNRQAYKGTIPVVASNVYVGYNASTIDDDNVGTSAGNGNGTVNPGETIELRVQVKNFGIQTATAVAATISSDDPYVSIVDAAETFGDIPAGATAWSADDFDVTIASSCAHGRSISLDLAVTSGINTWHSLVRLPVVSADLVADGSTLYNVGGNGVLDPGESGQLSVALLNNGGAAAVGTSATLASSSPYVIVTDAGASYGTINPGARVENIADRFGIAAATDAYRGHVATLSLVTSFSGAATDTSFFTVTVGARAAGDPVGPDRYGYLAFDNTDVTYPDAPTYQWIEIDPAYGGNGTEVALTDFGTYEDDSEVIDLPFPFVYYGASYTKATVCSNGWIAMGSTYTAEYRNWTIPGAGGPQAMIAGFWDDLRLNPGKVLQSFDAASHRLIVEWSRVANEFGGQQTFQIILYDPAYYPTLTGDGPIVFQYDTVDNNDYEDNYATVGIENPMQNDGVLYSFYDQYPTGAAPLASGRAIRFVTYLNMPSGVLQGTVTNASFGGNPIGGATVTILETGRTFFADSDGRFSGTTAIGTYTVAGGATGFAPDTLRDVVITEGQTTEIAFALHDIAGPEIREIEAPESTTDTTGPYTIRARVIDASGVDEAWLYYRLNGGGWIPVLMTAQGDQYTASLPGYPPGIQIDFYLRAQDGVGISSTSPANAPAGFYTFWITLLSYEYDVENPDGPSWQLGAPGDQATIGIWVRADPNGTEFEGVPIQPEDDHTADPGVSCFVTGQGNVGGAAGEADVDGGCTTLVSPNFDVSGALQAFLSYHRWYGEGGNSTDDTFAVDVSNDGGASWVPLERVPDIANTWQRVSFNVGQFVPMTESLQFRFVACDLNAGGLVEAAIDDVRLEVFMPMPMDAPDARIPTRVELAQNRPNPFGPATRISYGLPRSEFTRISVFDAAGRRVRNLVEATQQAGMHEITWDGRDDAGRPVGSGVYFYRLEAGSFRESRPMTILR